MPCHFCCGVCRYAVWFLLRCLQIRRVISVVVFADMPCHFCFGVCRYAVSFLLQCLQICHVISVVVFPDIPCHFSCGVCRYAVSFCIMASERKEVACCVAFFVSSYIWEYTSILHTSIYIYIHTNASNMYPWVTARVRNGRPVAPVKRIIGTRSSSYIPCWRILGKTAILAGGKNKICEETLRCFCRRQRLICKIWGNCGGTCFFLPVLCQATSHGSLLRPSN